MLKATTVGAGVSAEATRQSQGVCLGGGEVGVHVSATGVTFRRFRGDLSDSATLPSMSNARATAAEHPAVLAAQRAPKGAPLSDEERARVEAMRKAKPEELVTHAEILRQLDERKHRDE